MTTMHKFLRIQAHQFCPNYRVMDTYSPRRSYLMPMPSTIVGMIHKQLGWQEHHKMKICILEKSTPKSKDTQTFYYFSGMRYEGNLDKKGNPKRARHQAWALNNKGVDVGITRGVSEVEILGEVLLDIYISFEKDEDRECAFKKLTQPDEYPSLGRWEDLLEITKVSLGETETKSDVIDNGDSMMYSDGKELIDYTILDDYPVFINWKIDHGVRVFNTKNLSIVNNAVGTGEQFKKNIIRFI